MAKRSPRYNEPLPRRSGDRLPRARRAAEARLEPVVRARLQLERQLRVCGTGPVGRSLRLTAAHRTALVAMLSEADSPLSASLRAHAAAAVGPLKLSAALPALRRMVLDEADDLQTRVNAASSYVSMRGAAMARELPRLLRAREPMVRAALYVAAAATEAPTVKAAARAGFERERNTRVRAMVVRRMPGLSQTPSTRADS